MKTLRNLIFNFGSTTSPWVTIVLIVSLNISWVVTLDVFGKQFKQLAGYLPVDLQNTSAILSPAQAIEQITSYPPEARIFYWVFFILDNLMPPLVFGAFALLWAYYLSRHRNGLFDRLSTSLFVLLPLGVGVFDWLENLSFATFGITFLLTGFHLIMSLGYILMGTNTSSNRQPIKP